MARKVQIPISPVSKKYGSSGAKPLGGSQKSAVSTMKKSEKARGQMHRKAETELKNR